jgi:hypothetical protein
MRPERRLEPGVEGGPKAAFLVTPPHARQTELRFGPENVPRIQIEKPTCRSCERCSDGRIKGILIANKNHLFHSAYQSSVEESAVQQAASHTRHNYSFEPAAHYGGGNNPL